MLGLYAGLRREEILALKWDSVYLDVDCPYLTVRRAWHTENNRPVLLDELKTKAAHRNIPLPVCLADCLKAVSYTHLDVYKRQPFLFFCSESRAGTPRKNEMSQVRDIRGRI